MRIVHTCGCVKVYDEDEAYPFGFGLDPAKELEQRPCADCLLCPGNPSTCAHARRTKTCHGCTCCGADPGDDPEDEDDE